MCFFRRFLRQPLQTIATATDNIIATMHAQLQIPLLMTGCARRCPALNESN